MLGSARIDSASQEVISFVLDLSERKADQAIIAVMRRERIADAKFRSLLESAPDAMVISVIIASHLKVCADRSLMRVLLDNLICNAFKFTAHTPSPRIEIGTRCVAGSRSFFVSDNGAGFSMEYAGKLIVAFQRLHGTHEYPGTRIGLATVARIVSRHGGKLWAEGEVGRGATFSFSLPR